MYNVTQDTVISPPGTVISPAGNSDVTKDTVMSPARTFVLNTNSPWFEI